MRKKNIMPEINSLLENKAKIQSLARLLGIHTGFTAGVRFCRHPLMFVKPRQTHKHPLLSRQSERAVLVVSVWNSGKQICHRREKAQEQKHCWHINKMDQEELGQPDLLFVANHKLMQIFD